MFLAPPVNAALRTLIRGLLFRSGGEAKCERNGRHEKCDHRRRGEYPARERSDGDGSDDREPVRGVI